MISFFYSCLLFYPSLLPFSFYFKPLIRYSIQELMKSNDENRTMSLRKDTRILTDGGVFRIQDLKNAFFHTRGLNGWNLSYCRKTADYKRMYEVTLTNGKKYWCTSDHIWSVKRDTPGSLPQIDEDSRLQLDKKIVKPKSIMTSEIKPGDTLVYQKTNQLFDVKNNIGNYTDGFCIGLLYCSPVQFVSAPEPGQCVWCIDKASSVFPILTTWLNSIDKTYVQVTEQKSETNDEYLIITTMSVAVWQYINKFGIATYDEVKCSNYGIPSIVWTGCERFRKGFVDAVFNLSGRIYQETGICHIFNKSKTFIFDMWDLFGFYGIAGTMKQDLKTPTGDTVMPLLLFEASAFEHVFTITHAQKSRILRNMRKPQNSTGTVDILSVIETEIHEPVWDIILYDSHTLSLSHCITGLIE